MQSFLTYIDWAKTAQSLDNRRLGKQRLEALQTLRQLTTGKGGYPHHPINFMWRHNKFALGIYGMQMCFEWSTQRRFADQMFFEFQREIEALKKSGEETAFSEPPWRRDVDVLRSHRSNLIRKQDAGEVGNTWDYREQFPKTPEGLPYLWPRVSEDGSYELLVSKADKVRLAAGERNLPDKMRERVTNL